MCSNSVNNNRELKLIFALDLIRHGDRAPLHTIPILSDPWPEKTKGHLTSLGAQQSKELGKNFRDYYIKKTKLLSTKYNKNNVVNSSTC
jgi:lysosomal acid phosphatase